MNKNKVYGVFFFVVVVVVVVVQILIFSLAYNCSITVCRLSRATRLGLG